MKEHEPYSEADWQRDIALRLEGVIATCPDCGSDGDFGPKEADRHYRACKVCGFWQFVDEEPFRCWQSQHECMRQGPPMTHHCVHCDRTYHASPDGWIVHRCGKYLKPWDDGYTCQTCEASYGRESEVGWKRAGSG